jgi:predicted acylesterase/phospholipase RssA
VRFQVCAASIERAAEHWFTSGPLVAAIVASAAVPGLLPPAKVGDEHFLDGGIVNSIPLGRAVALGLTAVYVLQVGRIDRPSVPPTALGGGRVSFEIARRHRFAAELSEVPDGVVATCSRPAARRRATTPLGAPRLHGRRHPDRGDVRASARLPRRARVRHDRAASRPAPSGPAVSGRLVTAPVIA